MTDPANVPKPDPRPEDVVGPDPVQTDNGPKPDDPSVELSQDPKEHYEDVS